MHLKSKSNFKLIKALNIIADIAKPVVKQRRKITGLLREAAGSFKSFMVFDLSIRTKTFLMI
jgi:hypothetical protein